MKSDRRSHPQATRRQRGRRWPRGVTETDRVPHKAALGDRIRPQRTWPREGGETCYFH